MPQILNNSVKSSRYSPGFGLVLFLLASLIVNTSAMSSGVSKVLISVRNQIQKRPSVTNGIVGCVLFASSDIFAQQIEKAQEEANKTNHPSPLSLVQFPRSLQDVDVRRFLSAAVVGAILSGGVYPFAYKQIDRIWTGTNVLSICKKSVFEIFTVGIFANSVSMACRGVLKGHKPGQVVRHVAQEMPGVTVNDFKVWFPYNMIAFGWIPQSVRPATTSLMEVAWQSYISLRSNAYEHRDEEKDTLPSLTKSTTAMYVQ